MELKAVTFDLGGTLVRYYEREQFPSILDVVSLVWFPVADAPPFFQRRGELDRAVRHVDRLERVNGSLPRMHQDQVDVLQPLPGRQVPFGEYELVAREGMALGIGRSR